MVEDSEPFRKIICSILGKRPELQIVGEVSDGLEAVQKAEELQPDLISLDIGLPTLGGIEAARRIRKLSPQSRIIFVSQDTSVHVVQAALAEGANGYVVKADLRRELLTAVDAVLRGEQFVGRRFSAHDFIGASDAVASQGFQTESAVAPLQRSIGDRSAATRSGSILTMQICLMILRGSLRLLSKRGMRLLLSQPSHTGIAFC